MSQKRMETLPLLQPHHHHHHHLHQTPPSNKPIQENVSITNPLPRLRLQTFWCQTEADQIFFHLTGGFLKKPESETLAIKKVWNWKHPRKQTWNPKMVVCRYRWFSFSKGVFSGVSWDGEYPTFIPTSHRIFFPEAVAPKTCFVGE